MAKNDWLRYAQMFVGMTPAQQEDLLNSLEPKLARQAYEETNSSAELSAGGNNPLGNPGETTGENNMVNNDLTAMLGEAQPLATQARYHHAEAAAYPGHLGVPEFVFTVEPTSYHQCDGEPAYTFAGIRNSKLRMTSKGIMGKVEIHFRNGERLNTSHADDGGMGHLKVAYLPDEVAAELYNRLEANRADGRSVAVQVHLWNTVEFARPGSVYQTTFEGKESYRLDVTLDGNFSFEIIERGHEKWVLTRNSDLELSKDDYVVDRPVPTRKKSAMEFIREDLLRKAAKQDSAPSATAPSASSDDDDADVVL